VDDESKYRYKGKPTAMPIGGGIRQSLKNKNENISSKVSKFSKGFKILDDRPQIRGPILCKM
jgi:hypothetical protein